MSSTNQRPIIPSADYRWGLSKLSTGQTWVGLTERETLLIYEMVAKQQEENWMIWNVSWPEWKPLASFEKKWTSRLADFPNDWPRPKLKEQK